MYVHADCVDIHYKAAPAQACLLGWSAAFLAWSETRRELGAKHGKGAQALLPFRGTGHTGGSAARFPRTCARQASGRRCRQFRQTLPAVGWYTHRVCMCVLTFCIQCVRVAECHGPRPRTRGTLSLPPSSLYRHSSPHSLAPSISLLLSHSLSCSISRAHLSALSPASLSLSLTSPLSLFLPPSTSLSSPLSLLETVVQSIMRVSPSALVVSSITHSGITHLFPHIYKCVCVCVCV